MVTINTLYNEDHIDGFNNLMKAASKDKHSVYKARFACFTQLIHTLNYTFKAEYKKAYDITILTYSRKKQVWQEKKNAYNQGRQQYQAIVQSQRSLISKQEQYKSKMLEELNDFRESIITKQKRHLASLTSQQKHSEQDSRKTQVFTAAVDLLKKDTIERKDIVALQALNIISSIDFLCKYDEFNEMERQKILNKQKLQSLDKQLNDLKTECNTLKAILKPQVELPVSPTAVIDQGDDDKKAQLPKDDAILPAPVAAANCAGGAAVGAVADAVKQPTSTAAAANKEFF